MVRKKIKFFETMSGRHRTKATLNLWFCIILGYKTGNVDKFGKDDKNISFPGWKEHCTLI